MVMVCNSVLLIVALIGKTSKEEVVITIAEKWNDGYVQSVRAGANCFPAQSLLSLCEQEIAEEACVQGPLISSM
jgi:hypothetical protein